MPHRSWPLRRPIFSLLAAIALASPLAAQTTFTVTNPGDGGPASLSFWLNAASSGDTIVFAPALDGQTIILSGELLIGNRAILIDASALPGGITLSGDASLIGDPSDNLRHFLVANGGDLELRNLTISDGNSANSLTSPSLGGAILGEAGSSLTLLDCRFENNTTNGSGGAIAADDVVAERCRFSANSAQARSGAVNLGPGSSHFTECTFDLNTAATEGGAIGCVNTANSLTERCTFSHNEAFQGGALYFVGASFTITNSTFAHNDATFDGGAIRMLNGTTCTISHSTFSQNSANLTGGGISIGGGVLNLENSVIAGNSNGGGASNGPDLFGTVSGVSGVNFVGDRSGAGGLGTLGIDVLTGDPNLQPLGDYGGPTETMAPAGSSPLVDAGVNPASPPATDQRGEDRIFDGDGDGTATIDIGAVEYSLVPLVVTTALDEDDGALGLGAGDSLRECLAEANTDPGLDTIIFDPLLDGATITLGGTELTISSAVDVDASTLPLGIEISAGGSSRVLSIPVQVPVTLSGLEVADGFADGVDPSDRCGGGILNRGILTLRLMRIADNIASASGGGICNTDTGVIKIETTTFERNKAEVFGGGVWNEAEGTHQICTSTFLQNRSAIDGGGLSTGRGTMQVARSTFATNTADRRGGAASVNPQADCNLLLDRVTISDNRAVQLGGGVNRGTFTGTTSTIVISNSIVARNFAGGQSEINDRGALLGSVTSSDSLLGGDPFLFPLGDYGGATQTMALLPGSAAIDAGDPLRTDASDQRGFPGTVDGNNDSSAVIDMGAVEFDPSEVFFFPPDLAEEASFSPDLLWNFGPLADSYEVFLGDSPQTLSSLGTTTDPWLRSVNLEPAKIYFWRIDATSGGSTVPSPVLSFTTRDPLVVTTSIDEDDGALGMGAGDSLRETLAAAENTLGYDLVTFDPGLSGAVTLLNGSPLEILSSTDIDGSTLDLAPTLSGNHATNLLLVRPGSKVTLDSLVLIDGLSPDNTTGGAIFNQGGLFLLNLRISGTTGLPNHAAIGNVGTLVLLHTEVSSNATRGINNFEGEMTVEDSMICSNGGEGICSVSGTLLIETSSLWFNASGAIACHTTPLVIRASTISSNSGGSGLSWSDLYSAGVTALIEDCNFIDNVSSTGGGGIVEYGSQRAASGPQPFRVIRSMIAGNSAPYGGGVAAYGAGVRFENSTIARNAATAADGSGLGGGVWMSAGSVLSSTPGAQVEFESCTIVENQAETGGGIASADGPLAPLATLLHCVLARNTATIKAHDFYRLLDTFDNPNPALPGPNLIGNNWTIMTVAPADGLLVGDNQDPVDPRLWAPESTLLAEPVFAPRLDSPALDRGGPVLLDTDQLGQPRVAGPALDLGAIELQDTTVVTITQDTGPGSLRNAIVMRRPDGTLMFDPAMSGQVISLVSGPIQIAGVCELDAASLPGGLTISGGGLTSLFEVESNGNLLVRNINFLRGRSTESGGAFRNSGALTLENCTIANCLAFFDGGAIQNDGSLTITNSTVSGNFAGNYGGGIVSSGVALCRHSTLVDNEAFFAEGGGIFNDGGLLTLENSILARNFAPGGFDNLAGPFTELGNNLLTGDPRLAPLANYGGPTLTRPPLPGSPALEGAVLLGSTPPTDQIGNPRPSGPLPDLGAVEAISVAAALAPLTDSEPDGIPDLLEGPGGAYPHLDPTVDDSALDTDHDGSPDAEEIANMTDPLDGNDLFRILSIGPATGFHAQLNPLVDVTLATFPGLSYSFETDPLLQNFQLLPGSTVVADDYEETVQLLLAPDRDFVRGRRE